MYSAIQNKTDVDSCISFILNINRNVKLINFDELLIYKLMGDDCYYFLIDREKDLKLVIGLLSVFV